MASQERYVGIDYVRALFSVCVVAVHLGYIAPSSVFDQELYTHHQFTWSDFINFYVLLLAVPMFLIVSHYLSLRKPADWSVCLRQLKRIACLGVFWTLLYLVFIHQGFRGWWPGSPRRMVTFLVSAGGTPYYFFVSLIGLTVLTYVVRSIRTRYIVVLFALTTAWVSILPFLAKATGIYKLAIYWNPMSFLPYPFAAILVSRLRDGPLGRRCQTHLVIAWLLSCLLAMVVDWIAYPDAGFFTVTNSAIPAYSRPSLVFLSTAVLFLAVKVRPGPNAVISFMSRYSLGLYCLHPFFLPHVIRRTDGQLLMSLPIVLLASYVSTKILSHVLRRELLYAG